MPSQEEKWKLQIRSLVLSPHAILKSSLLAALWLVVGFALGIYYNYGIAVIFIIVALTVLWFFPFWQPVYSLVYWIVGNKKISPRLETFQWTRVYAVSLSVRAVFLAFLVYVAVRMLTK